MLFLVTKTRRFVGLVHCATRKPAERVYQLPWCKAAGEEWQFVLSLLSEVAHAQAARILQTVGLR